MANETSADVHVVLGLRWTEAFPWIAGAARATGRARGDAEPWWLDLVAATPADALDSRLAALSDMALIRTKWSLGELFPLLPQSTPLDLLPFTNRARNALTRRGLVTTSDLQGMLLVELLDLPNVGFGTADSILRILAQACIEQPASHTYVQQPDLFAAPTQPVVAPSASLPLAFTDDFCTVASWFATLGLTDLPLLGASVPPGTPSYILKAHERLLHFCAADALPDDDVAELGIASLLEAELQQLAHLDRSLDVLTRRFFADIPQTLDEIARPLGVTRERVRQLESKARAQLVQALDGDAPLAVAGAAVRELVGTLLPLNDLLRLVPALGDIVDSVDQPAWRVLDRLDDAYEIEDGWCAAPSIKAAKTATQTELFEKGGKHGVVTLADVALFHGSQHVEVPEESTRAWLAYCGYVIQDSWIFTRTGSVGDRAAAVLFVRGTPLSVQQILDLLPVDSSINSLRNALARDDRFKRVDRDKWALAEWEGEAYSGIKGQIRQELARNGGEIAINSLVEKITGQYSVSPNSVVAYASNPPFESRDGRVRFATGGRDSKKPLQRTARLYRQGTSLFYRITISTDHLRGSGFPAPVALASELGLQRGTSCRLGSPLGTHSLNWTNLQPAFGSIGSLLIKRGDIETGQEVFLVIGPDRSFDIRPIDDKETDSLSRALRLVGYNDAAATDPLPALARAIDLPENSPITSVIGGYRDRGDSEVADLLLAVRAQLENSEEPQSPTDTDGPVIDEILGLL